MSDIYTPLDNNPEWNLFMGNNQIQIGSCQNRWMGFVDLGVYIGKTLDEACSPRLGHWAGLWRDLMSRYAINGLCIYRYNNGQWTVGWGPGHCNIELDQDNRIERILIVPYPRPKE